MELILIKFQFIELDYLKGGENNGYSYKKFK